MKPKIGVGFRTGKLTVSEPTGERKNGYAVWNCACDCGGVIHLDTRTLQRGTVRDCGCPQREAILDNLCLVDGTSVTKLEAMRGRRLSSNTSGCTGVYWNAKNRKWAAQITFRSRTHYLGTYDKIEDAVKARKRGEEMHDDFLEWYYETHSRRKKTEEKANQNP